MNMKPPVWLADGTAEALKWLALALMVLDHANQYLCNSGLALGFPNRQTVISIVRLCAGLQSGKAGNPFKRRGD